MQRRPSWHLGLLDKDGPHGWHQCHSIAFWNDLLPRLKSFESMKWSEITGNTGSHFIRLDQIEKSAIDRLVELQLDDIEEIYSLRISGACRIFGIMDRSTLKLIWYDPDHKVCLSRKKHT